MAEGGTIYSTLLTRGMAHGSDLFDTHVAASILALAMEEGARNGTPLTDGCGLDGRELRALFVGLFPGALSLLDGHDLASPAIAEEESNLRDILGMNAAHASPFELLLARMIARRCLRPNHLWQDLGLRNRAELTMVMARHFPRLAKRNSNDMKWKKFFYRMMCSATGFSLCAAPVCGECDDFDACFGDEDGQAMLALNTVRGDISGGRAVVS